MRRIAWRVATFLLAPAAVGSVILLGRTFLIPSPVARAESLPRIEVTPLELYRPQLSTMVRLGDTLETICRRLAGSDWVAWRDALATRLDARRLQPGLLVEATASPWGRLDEMRVVLDRRVGLTLRRQAGSISCTREERPVEHQALRLEGEIRTSLFEAVDAAGADAELALRMADIFQWDIDFFRDLRKGDRFSLVVDREMVDGSHYRYGTVYAARFVNDGRVREAVAFLDDGGRQGYYEPDGRPMRKQFLRSPLQFSRVTSRFSMRRFHPIQKRVMPHYGVDYGAPVGTPVHATADGTATFVGSNRGAGRMVTLRHPNGYQTSYLHLSRFASGIRNGARVAQGQVIGYVGSSGASTGPHLDYRVQANGRYTNPMTLASPPAEPLVGARLAEFKAHAAAAMALLQGKEATAAARWYSALGAQPANPKRS